MARPNRPLISVPVQDVERFHSRCRSTPDGCRLWMGEMASNGLGLFDIWGRKHYAARVAWVIIKGPIPYGHVLEATCGEERCINPDHQKLSKRTRVWSGGKKEFVPFVPWDIRKELADINKDLARADALEREAGRLREQAIRAKLELTKRKPWIGEDYSELQGDSSVPFVSVVKQR